MVAVLSVLECYMKGREKEKKIIGVFVFSI